MKIIGIETMTVQEVNHEVRRGGRFVYYQYCVSIVVASARHSSSIYFIRGGCSATMRGLPFTLVSFFLGWWGIPHGLVWTIKTLATNLSGGIDVTGTVISSVNATAAARAAAGSPDHPADRPRQSL